MKIGSVKDFSKGGAKECAMVDKAAVMYHNINSKWHIQSIRIGKYIQDEISKESKDQKKKEQEKDLKGEEIITRRNKFREKIENDR